MVKNKFLKKWRYMFIGVILIYILIIFIGFLLIKNIPDVYLKLQEITFEKTKNSINEAIKNNDKVALKKIEDESFSDFIIFKNTDFLYYGTLNAKSPSDLALFREKKDISFEELYRIENNNEKYDVWIAQYFIKAQNLYDYIILGLMVFTVILISSLIIGITILFFKFLKPLKSLQNNILKISSYRLDEINGNQKINEADFLSLELENFARDLNSKIKNTEITYTALEYDLTHKNELMIYRSKMIASLTHDLKAPIHTAILQLEDVQKESKDERLRIASKSLLKAINEVKDITAVAYSNNLEQLTEFSDFDLISLFEECASNFIFLFKSKNIKIDYEFDESIVIHNNKILFKQLIHNAFSNIYSYTLESGYSEIKCFVENNKIFISFYNDANKLSEVDLKNVFNLFHRVSDDSLGSGTGLYAIKNIVLELKGNINFDNFEDGVILSIEIPMEVL